MNSDLTADYARKQFPVTVGVQQTEYIFSHWQIGLLAWCCSCWPAMLYGLQMACQLDVPPQAQPPHKMDQLPPHR